MDGIQLRRGTSSLLTEYGQEKAVKLKRWFATMWKITMRTTSVSSLLDEEWAIRKTFRNSKRQDQNTVLTCKSSPCIWRASLLFGHAATVLKNLIKKPGTSPLRRRARKVSLAMGKPSIQVMLCSLLFLEQKLRETLGQANAGHRRHAVADYIGHEEPLVDILNEQRLSKKKE
jgi:hypothetical protein